MEIIEFLTAAGIGGVIGSLLTTFVQAWLAQRSYIASRNFQEKKEAYIGLLNAYRQACLKSGNEEQKNFAYWAVRCELVASEEIRLLIEKMKDNEQQVSAFVKVKELMRKDLGVEF